MDALEKKVKKLLERGFPPPDQIELENDEGLVGTIVSNQFKGMDSIDRVNLMWSYLEKDLSPDESRRVVLLLGMTPREKLLHST